MASASAWVQADFWFQHAVQARNCNPECTHPHPDNEDDTTEKVKKVSPYDMGPLFQKMDQTSYLKIWDARKAMANYQKEYRPKDTWTYKNMSAKETKLLQALPNIVKEALPSKILYHPLSMNYNLNLNSFRLQIETRGL